MHLVYAFIFNILSWSFTYASQWQNESVPMNSMMTAEPQKNAGTVVVNSGLEVSNAMGAM